MDTKTERLEETTAVLEPPSLREHGEMEILVRVEVGEVRMPLGQASGLVPGRVLLLDREVGPKVFLKVGDKLMGYGELVEHDGFLAVEITEVP